MILQTADGSKFRVSFRHYVPGKDKKGRQVGVLTYPVFYSASAVGGPCKVWGVKFSRRPKTECVILSTDNVGLVKTEARCNPRDTFSKPMGRRVALGRALAEMVVINMITAVQRTQLMADYFTKVQPR